LLQGRTLVLDGHQVRASDVLVVAAGIAALVLGALTALLALRPLIALHRAAAQRAGLEPSRTAAGLLARLVVPGWNLYGAGQVLTEIARLLRRTDGGRRRSTRITVPLWWLAWVANGLLVLATLIMAFGRSEQLMADTVEMHIAVDLVGALVAGLFAAVLVSFERAWSGRGSHRYAGWAVRPPESAARNRMAPTGGDGPGEPPQSAGERTDPEPAGDEHAEDERPDAERSDGLPAGDEGSNGETSGEEPGAASAPEPDRHPR
jgi:DMSO/TMAO reductase YedYZ molybdopterin-dependent catalytic subunit